METRPADFYRCPTCLVMYLLKAHEVGLRCVLCENPLENVGLLAPGAPRT